MIDRIGRVWWTVCTCKRGIGPAGEPYCAVHRLQACVTPSPSTPAHTCSDAEHASTVRTGGRAR
jgi:hypothetical protein